jgi:hypothetical protein
MIGVVHAFSVSSFNVPNWTLRQQWSARVPSFAYLVPSFLRSPLPLPLGNIAQPRPRSISAAPHPGTRSCCRRLACLKFRFVSSPGTAGNHCFRIALSNRSTKHPIRQGGGSIAREDLAGRTADRNRGGVAERLSFPRCKGQAFIYSSWPFIRPAWSPYREPAGCLDFCFQQDGVPVLFPALLVQRLLSLARFPKPRL